MQARENFTRFENGPVNKMPELFKTPILFLTFNRPDTTRIVFNEILKVRPAQLYIAQDGPRKNKPGETEKCRQVREIFKHVNPDCAVKTLFRENNLGCKEAASSAITWFFENVSEGIILEDDCLPHPDFFRFCREMLERYRDNEKIMHISGDNFNFGEKAGNSSYYFSKFVYIWGWATWHRAWRHYDLDMKTWPEFVKQNRMSEISKYRRLRERWTETLQNTYLGKTNAWDYQLMCAIWNQNGLCINPNVNLVANIGFGKGATHTTNKKSKLAVVESCAIDEITHPLIIQRAGEDDELHRKNWMPSIVEKIKNREKRPMSKIIFPLPETIFKLFLAGVNPKFTRHNAYTYRIKTKYLFCLLVYKTLGMKSAVNLAEIIEKIEE